MRLKHYDYSSAGMYFVTICTKDRKHIFGEVVNGVMQLNHLGCVVKTKWGQLPKRYLNAELGEFVIMPNHVHGIITITESDSAIVGEIHEFPLRTLKIMRSNRRNMLLSKIVGYLKMNTAKEINQILDTAGMAVWQRGFYERVIRNDEELNNTCQYILGNPMNWDNDPENVVMQSSKGVIH